MVADPALAVRSVEVRSGAYSYEVRIGAGLLGDLGEFVRPIFRGERAAIVADENVAPLYGTLARDSLRCAGFTAEMLTIPAGETSKSLASAGALCAKLSALELDRGSFVVSLGGGVTGDLTGFVASIYLRGIPYVSVPTTLLAQVDSCLGGKTGVNTDAGKNLIGTFHHPSFVLADTETLGTLPERIWNEGFAEAIKHGIIRDAALFESAAKITRENAAEFVAQNIALKAAIVEADEREQNGTRALLNFGHTIGHAIEHAAGYGTLLHGEAISLGMVAAAWVSVRRAGLSLGDCDRIIAALQGRQLPVALPSNFPREKIFAALTRDKKFENGRIRFVVAHEIGRASVSDEVTLEDLRDAVAHLSSRAERD
ncbi:MAG: 3-dehydroquinate synthase [Chthoniobacterales bacterium]|nr:3-dehydroquinate synthase [Chthoniobacterales bacterium]